MIVSDPQKAHDYLSKIGYYRLSAYWHPFRKTDDTVTPSKPLDEFKDETDFHTIVDLYVFDKKLRLLLMDLIERIEIALRSEVAIQMGPQSPWAHRDATMLDKSFSSRISPGKSTTGHSTWVSRLDERAATSKEPFAVHFRNEYPGSPMPIWMAVELLEFGALSHLLSGMRTGDVRPIAGHYAIPRPELLKSWVRALCGVRNICAHHGRLWNKPIFDEPKPPFPTEIPALDHVSASSRQRVYGTIAVGRYLLKAINPGTQWHNRLKVLAANFPVSKHISLSTAGFPPQWQQLPLWT